MVGLTESKLSMFSRLLRTLADMIDNGFCDHLELSDIEKCTEVLAPLLDVKVDYEQAAKIVDKSKVNLIAKISRSFIAVYRSKKLIKYSDALKIRDKKV